MKKTYYITIILTILLILVSTYSYAAEITKQDLIEYFGVFKDEKTGKQMVEVTDNKIVGKLTSEININYDLTGKPTFWEEGVIKNGMSFEECFNANKSTNLILPFSAIADIKGFNKGSSYFYDKVTSSESHTKFENIGLEIQNNFIDAKDYVEKKYSKDVIVEDELFTLTITKEDIAEGEYKIISKLIVHTDKDFSIIEGKTNNTVTDDVNNITTPTRTPLPTKTPSTANIGTMPNAGFEINTLNILKVVLGLSISALIVYGIYNKRYNSK